MSYLEKMQAAKEALKAALGDAAYEDVFPGSIRVDGDNVDAKMDMGDGGTKPIRVSLSNKKVVSS